MGWLIAAFYALAVVFCSATLVSTVVVYRRAVGYYRRAYGHRLKVEAAQKAVTVLRDQTAAQRDMIDERVRKLARLWEMIRTGDPCGKVAAGHNGHRALCPLPKDHDGTCAVSLADAPVVFAVPPF